MILGNFGSFPLLFTEHWKPLRSHYDTESQETGRFHVSADSPSWGGVAGNSEGQALLCVSLNDVLKLPLCYLAPCPRDLLQLVSP